FSGRPKGHFVNALLDAIDSAPRLTRFGRVARLEGLLVEVTGAQGATSLGARVNLASGRGDTIPCEVVGFREGRALAMPFGTLDAISLGARATFDARSGAIYPCEAWLGRVLDAHGRAADGKGALPLGMAPYALRAAPPAAHMRARVGGKLDLGVRALNQF